MLKSYLIAFLKTKNIFDDNWTSFIQYDKIYIENKDMRHSFDLEEIFQFIFECASAPSTPTVYGPNQM